jgi:GH15 family glucan-1,4-alpha-glucosidase
MWSAVVVGTHPVEADQEVWLEISADDVSLGPLPAYWVENKGQNSFWHVPIPPQAVGARLRYRSAARHDRADGVFSPNQDVLVRPNLPDRTAATEIVSRGPEGLVGNRMMTVRVDSCGSTYDVYFPTVGLHSDVRPSEGDLPQSRSHFRAIVGGLAVGRRLDWFAERFSWEVFQRYQGATNLLVTELKWRNGPIRVLATDFVAMGPNLPRTAGGTESPGQYLKRFRIGNEDSEPRRALFGVYVQAEVNGGVGEPGLSWLDGDRTLLASNRGHGHANRKLARDATVEFALAFDDRGDVFCEPTGANEAILLRWLDLPPNGSVTVDLLVSGAFTGWRGDHGTFEHWLRPALAWFRSTDLDQVEHDTAQQWDSFTEHLPNLDFPRGTYAVGLRRCALAASLHADAKWGAIAAGFDRGIHAYCWPRDSIWASGALDRLGHTQVGRGVFEWLSRVRGQNRPYAYWFQKYTIDGWPEWETPAVDQTAVIPWGLERHFRRTGDLDFVAACWPMIDQAATVCAGGTRHPGLRWIDDLSLISSGGIWDNRFGAFLYSNACVVAGLRSAARLAEALDRPEPATRWRALADCVWEVGILGQAGDNGKGPGLVDPASGRFLDARRLSTLRGLWSDRPEFLVERSAVVDISLISPAVPFGLMPAADPRVRACCDAILRHNSVAGDPNVLTRWSFDPAKPSQNPGNMPAKAQMLDVSSLATLWMARYLIQLGRETGESRHWSRALAMIDGVIGCLGPLGLAVRPSNLDDEDWVPAVDAAPGVWGLHAMLTEAMLDLAGFDYDGHLRTLILEPALPPTWPHIGLSQRFRCGEASYRLERLPGGTAYRMTLVARLKEPVTLQVDLTCPGLTDLGPWRSMPAVAAPRFDRTNGRLTWTASLATGESFHEWTWGAETTTAPSPSEGRGVGSAAG